MSINSKNSLMPWLTLSEKTKLLRQYQEQTGKTSQNNGAVKLNRSSLRKALSRKNRYFTKKGYAFGNKIGGKTLGLAEHFYKKENRNDR